MNNDHPDQPENPDPLPDHILGASRPKSSLSADESKRLAQCEADIDAGLKAYFKAGLALAVINKNRLYRDQYQTFEEYCAQRWIGSRQHGYRLIDAAELGLKMLELGCKSIPRYESVMRELLKLSPAEGVEVWEGIIENNENPTAPVVKTAVAKYISERDAQLKDATSIIGSELPVANAIVATERATITPPAPANEVVLEIVESRDSTPSPETETNEDTSQTPPPPFQVDSGLMSDDSGPDVQKLLDTLELATSSLEPLNASDLGSDIVTTVFNALHQLFKLAVTRGFTND